MKKMLLFVLMALGLASAGFCKAPILLSDGEWHLDVNYGPGGKTWKIVQDQMELYKDARAELKAIQSGETVGNLREATRACERYALYTFVKCQFAAMLGDQALAKGNYALADGEYRRSLSLAIIARTVDTHESTHNRESVKFGKIYEAKALAHLKFVAKKLGQPALKG